MPEKLWKTYIDFEVEQGESENVRRLYERLLERTMHVKVWIAYAKFELENNIEEEGVDKIATARRIFERGNDALRTKTDKDNRALILEAWRDFENDHGNAETQKKIMEKMPRRVKCRRRVVGEDGVSLLF